MEVPTAFTVRTDDKLALVINKVFKHGKPARVVDDNGTPVGSITSERILDALYGAEG